MPKKKPPLTTEKNEALADVAWWRSHLPTGWTVYGFNFRLYATFISPQGRLVEIDGELLVAMRGQTPPQPGVSIQDEGTFATMLKEAGVPIIASWGKPK